MKKICNSPSYHQILHIIHKKIQTMQNVCKIFYWNCYLQWKLYAVQTAESTSCISCIKEKEFEIKTTKFEKKRQQETYQLTPEWRWEGERRGTLLSHWTPASGVDQLKHNTSVTVTLLPQHILHCSGLINSFM